MATGFRSQFRRHQGDQVANTAERLRAVNAEHLARSTQNSDLAAVAQLKSEARIHQQRVRELITAIETAVQRETLEETRATLRAALVLAEDGIWQ
jgi:hypothetical protein